MALHLARSSRQSPPLRCAPMAPPLRRSSLPLAAALLLLASAPARCGSSRGTLARPSAPGHSLLDLRTRTHIPNRTEKASMKAMVPRRRGVGGGLRIKKKARSFMCGCGSSKAVSISDGSDKQSPMATPPTNMSNTTMTMSSTTTTTTATRRAESKTASSTAAAPSSFSPSSYADTDNADTSVESTPSVTALLRQLGELERTVRSLQGAVIEGGCGGRWHRQTISEGGGGGTGRVEESVAVVKESANPLADFRRSMLQMIVEKEIVGGAELRELLHRFLSLNSPRHHHLILRAFAEIWEEVFAGYERTPDFLVPCRRKKLPYANIASHTAHGHGESVS